MSCGDRGPERGEAVQEVWIYSADVTLSGAAKSILRARAFEGAKTKKTNQLRIPRSTQGLIQNTL